MYLVVCKSNNSIVSEKPEQMDKLSKLFIENAFQNGAPNTARSGPLGEHQGQAGGYAPRFQAFFVALSLVSFDGESRLSHQRVSP